jgi:hypothetical protein
MRHLSQPVPLDFAQDGQPIPQSAQLGVPVSAVSAVSAAYVWVQGDALMVSLNGLVEDDNTTVGKLELWAANDIVPQQSLAEDFEPIGWFKVAEVSVSGNGTFGTTTLIPVAFNFLQARWNPSAGAVGKIRGVMLWQGRP